MITDPLLPGVGWTWLVEALDGPRRRPHRGVRHRHPGGHRELRRDGRRGRHRADRDPRLVDAAGPRVARRPRRGVGRAALHRGRSAAGPRRRHRDAQPPGPAGRRDAERRSTRSRTLPRRPGPRSPPTPLLRLRDGAAGRRRHRRGAARHRARPSPPAPVRSPIDAERASGYRYSSRAYLIQLRREGAGTHLVDPIGLSTLAPLQEVLDGHRVDHPRRHPGPARAWPSSGWCPTSLFDTELAGRLLGYPRVGLATLVETLLGRRLAKEHSAVDWSTRPLPATVAGVRRPRRRGAGRAARRARRRAGRDRQGRVGPAGVRVGCVASRRPPGSTRGGVRPGVHRVRGRRAAGRRPRAVGAARPDRPRARRDPRPDPARLGDHRGRHRDAAATARPLLRTQGFHGRGAARYAAQWVEALQEVAELPEEELPTRAPRGDGPPLPRAWAEKDPVAARRLVLAREAVTALSERARGAGREPAHARPPAPAALDAAGDPRRRGARRARSTPSWRATAPGRGSAS